MKRKRRRQPCPLPLAELCRLSRFAPAVYLALCDMAAERGSPVVTPTLAELAERTGITRLPTITEALNALDACYWIDRQHVKRNDSGAFVTLLRIKILRRSAQISCATAYVKPAHRSAQKTSATARNPVAHKNRALREKRRSAQLACADSSYEEGRAAPPPLSGGDAERTQHVNRTPQDTPAERAAREAARERRLGEEPTPDW